jgi:flagellar hook-associated protein 2
MTVRNMAMSQLQMSGMHGIPGAPGRPAGPGATGNASRESTAVTNQNIRNAGSAIADALDTLTGRDAALEGRTSNAEAATVNVNNGRLIASMPPQNTTLNVIQTAQAQENNGNALAAQGRAIESGGFTFEIEAGGRVHEFTINVLDTDNNTSIQRAMADAINRRDIGITATVNNAVTGGNQTTALNLASTATGTGSAFTVRDTTGNLTETMGINTVNQQARNAIFTLNGGEERTSQSNDISLAAGVTATLTGTGETNITFGRNTDSSVNAATELVNAINSAMRGVNPNEGRGSRRFLEDLHGLTVTFESALSRIGINVQNNGTLSIDRERLQAAAEDGSLDRFFEGRGFAARVDRIAHNAANTNSYANRVAPVNVNNGFDFGNTQDQWNMFNLFG